MQIIVLNWAKNHSLRPIHGQSFEISDFYFPQIVALGNRVKSVRECELLRRPN